MAIILPELPYSKDALEPYISAKTLEFHHGKHHNAYVTNTNKLIQDAEFKNDALETIIKKAAENPSLTGLFNNAAQAWNHAFYWQCMKPGGGKPQGKIADLINATFGDYEKFLAEFKNAATTLFGSGWAWLVLNDNKLEILKSANAGTPLVHDKKPLLTIDVWEHAYYLDYQNRRPDYVAAFLENLVNWDFVNQNLE